MSDLIKAVLEDANKALSLDASASIGEVTEREWFSASRPLFANLARHVIALAAELKAARERAAAALDGARIAEKNRDDASARAEKAERQLKETQGYLVIERERINEHLRCAAGRDAALARAEKAEQRVRELQSDFDQADLERSHAVEVEIPAYLQRAREAEQERDEADLLYRGMADGLHKATIARDEARRIAGEHFAKIVQLYAALDALAKGRTDVPHSDSCESSKKCAACKALDVVIFWRNRGNKASEERDRLQACEDLRRNKPISVVACSECVACLRLTQERDTLRGQLADNRETIASLNRRCQQAESAALVTVAECRRERLSLGRNLAGWYGATKEQEVERLRIELEASRLATEITAKERGALAVRCLELEKAQEWLSIENAPKRGPIHLLEGDYVTVGFWDEPPGWWEDMREPSRVIKPTHWRPLPEPPKVTK